VRLNYACGDPWSQSLGCDGEAHTLVWVSMIRQPPALTLPHAEGMGIRFTSGCRGPPLSERASLRILLPAFA
jgi:hypothetical protein